MRVSWWKAGIIFLGCGLPGSMEAEGVLDHVGGWGGRPPSGIVLVTRVDLDGDGKEEWFATAPEMRNGKAGLVWTGFREGRDGLRVIGAATFHHGSAIGESEAGWGIHSLWAEGAGRIGVMRHYLSGGRVQSEQIAGVLKDEETDSLPDPWKSFMQRGRLTVEEIPREELYERYPALATVISGEGGGVSGTGGEARRNEAPAGSRRGASLVREEGDAEEKATGNRWPLWAAMGALALSLGYAWVKRR